MWYEHSGHEKADGCEGTSRETQVTGWGVKANFKKDTWISGLGKFIVQS